MCRLARTHDFLDRVCLCKPAARKKSFEWLSNSWGLHHEQRWLRQQKSLSGKAVDELRAGDAVVFPVLFNMTYS